VSDSGSHAGRDTRVVRMLCKIERPSGGPDTLECRSGAQNHQNSSKDHLAEIDDVIESLHNSLWPLNKSIHSNPELAFEEYKTHDALTKYMQSHKDWQITKSAYGLETAWIAVYDSRKPGPVVSFNAEMGASSPLLE
jgi:hypothetical protein